MFSWEQITKITSNITSKVTQTLADANSTFNSDEYLKERTEKDGAKFTEDEPSLFVKKHDSCTIFPWTGFKNEDAVMTKILKLSEDARKYRHLIQFHILAT
jgi:hypothetical protein